ncbi:MAG TPA: metalloregulator ArsR/SmtB family transcription factor [Ktedonobacterales bacterium]|nr:metalloregulator ArsR/SmtB family transcription factor [Ktedonobacterales bacterium]
MNTDIAAGFATLGEPTRRLIVERLASGPLSVHEIAMGLPVGRPAVSMHLRVLKDAGLVVDQRQGTQRLYQLNPEALAALRDYLDWYWARALAAYREAVEQQVERQEEKGVDGMAGEVWVAKSIVVEVPRVQAFEFFIRQDAWWPVATHHLAEPAGETVILEPFVGGRWFERGSDGRERDWGRALIWEPPRRIVLSWQIGPGWVYEPDPTKASEIEVRFLAESQHRTRVEFEHRHLERYGEQAEHMRSVLDARGGAAGVLQAYATRLKEVLAQTSVTAQ